MVVTAGSPAGGGNPAEQASDLRDAWRLAYLLVADRDRATTAVRRAYAEGSAAEGGQPPPRLGLLAATLRIGLAQSEQTPDLESPSAVTAALWQLAPEQRGALWLSRVNGLDDTSLGAVLGVTADNAGHVATRAAEWLDVTLDHDSGPLCPDEGRLAGYLTDRLPPEEAAEMREHVPGCPTCRAKVQAFEELADLPGVLTAAVPEPPFDLTAAPPGKPDRKAGNGGFRNSVVGRSTFARVVHRIRPHSRQRSFYTGPNGSATGAEPVPRVPAVRILALCCAALLILGLLGLQLVGTGKHRTAPVGPAAPAASHAILPGPTATAPSSGGAATSGGGSTAPAPSVAATHPTVAVTTTSIPAVTFPTLPQGGRKP
jgi:hypothetical protein